MFNIDKFYKDCESGDRVDCKDIVEYLKKYKYVIIRGAAGQGTAVGKKLFVK